MKKLKSIFFLSTIFIFSNCDFENDKKAIEPSFVNNKIEFPHSVYNWYRGVITPYIMGQSIKVEKQIIYVSISQNNNWTIFHSTQGYSFNGSGVYQFTTESNLTTGKIVGEALSGVGETSHYEISFINNNGKYKLILMGLSGAPNTELTTIKDKVTLESFLNDVAKTIL